MRAYLLLENGQVFEGIRIGSERNVISEVVFNTSMTGYVEVLTDRSYAGQAVVMTYPLIGNYGAAFGDFECEAPLTDAMIVSELEDCYSNFRAQVSFDSILKNFDIPGIQGIDTRALTRVLRENGTMNGMIVDDVSDKQALLEEIKNYKVQGVVLKSSVKEKYCVDRTDGDENALRVAVVDLGVKQSIIESLAKRGCNVDIYPADAAAEEILKNKYDGIMLTNGPGDPLECTSIIENVKRLYESSCPIFAICLGHQLMALATGATTYKLKYGHRGGNHPVKNIASDRTYITSQNHGYAVKDVDPKIANVSWVNMNDNTCEGLDYVGKKISTVQFHPEASPGPLDTAFLFDKFVNLMLDERKDG